MVSQYPYNVYDNSYMEPWWKEDLISKPKRSCNEYIPGTIMYIIDKNPDTTILSFMLKKTGLDQYLNNLQNNITLFAPLDEYLQNIKLNIMNESVGVLREMLLTNILQKKVMTSSFCGSEFNFMNQNKKNTCFSNTKNVLTFFTTISQDNSLVKVSCDVDNINNTSSIYLLSDDKRKIFLLNANNCATNGVIHYTSGFNKLNN